jgi:predicted nuclease of restriction endonuclease-like RecB superfamily
VLTKDLRRLSRAGGGYHPQFVGDDEDARRLAARVLGIYQGHVGEPRRELTAALEDLERESDDFKLVRGFDKLLADRSTFETRASIPPQRVRRAAFEAAEAVGVASADERATALTRAADALGTDADTVASSLYADREPEQVLVEVDADLSPATLCEQYDFALAAASLLDATTVRLRSSDPAALVSAVKRNGLLYEIRLTDADGTSGEAGIRAESDAGDTNDGTGGGPESSSVDTQPPHLSRREVVVTGPDALFRRTRRYGTAFANLLRSVARTAARWELTATVDDRGRQRQLELSAADVPVPDGAPTGEPAFDSGVEASFAARIRGLDLDWTLIREPEPLRVSPPPDADDDAPRVAVPDFAFVYDHADFRLFVEVMGFWTPSYVERKLDQLRGLEDVALLVAVDESLGVGEEIATTGSDVVTYDGEVRVKDVVDVLRRYEADLREAATAGLPAEFVPTADVVTVEELAETLAETTGGSAAEATGSTVPEDAIREVSFPDHEWIGDTLVRPAVLNRVAEELEPGQSFETASERLAAVGIDDASAALSRLGYRVAWEGLGGGELVRDDG